VNDVFCGKKDLTFQKRPSSSSEELVSRGRERGTHHLTSRKIGVRVSRECQLFRTLSSSARDPFNLYPIQEITPWIFFKEPRTSS
jgi:hypothetical protein